MQWLDRARSIVRGIHRISLPDPDRIDLGAVPDTVALLEAIDAAMPRTAVVELIGLSHGALAAFLAACPDAIQDGRDGYLLAVAKGAVGALARTARDRAADRVCAALLVHDGERTLLEAFGRDRGEDVVWLSRHLPKDVLRRFLDALSLGSAAAPRAWRPTLMLPHAIRPARSVAPRLAERLASGMQ